MAFVSQMAPLIAVIMVTSFLTLTSARTFDPDVQDMFSANPDGESEGVRLESFCEPDAEIPDDLIQCGSCENRCGKMINPDDLYFSSEPYRLCACDKFCHFHGDCCHDFQDFCPKEFHDFQKASEQYPFTQNYYDFKCQYFQGPGNNMVVHTCPDGSECEFTPELSEDVNTFVPMYDIHRGVHYISGQCAVCNGAPDVIPWGVSLVCLQTPPIPGVPEQEDSTISSEDSLTKAIDLQSGACSLNYTISGRPRPCVSEDIITSCPSGCQNLEVISRCESGSLTLTVLDSFFIYKNAHCALCNGERDLTTFDLSCGLRFLLTNHASDTVASDTFSLTLVFDFDPRNGLSVGDKCSDGEMFIPDEDACRSMTCPSGFYLVGSSCLPEPSNITAVVTGSLTNDLSSQTRTSLMNKKKNLESLIQGDVGSVMDSFHVSHEKTRSENRVQL